MPNFEPVGQNVGRVLAVFDLEGKHAGEVGHLAAGPDRAEGETASPDRLPV